MRFEKRNPPMRKPLHLLPLLVFALVSAVAAPAMAQAEKDKAPAADKPKQPAGLQPLEAPPAPPAGYDPSLEGRDVVVRDRGQDRIEEHRINGKLYMIKVTPKYGKPYYLVDDIGDGTWNRQEATDFGSRPPRWVVHTF